MAEKERVKICKCSYGFFAIMQALRLAKETPIQYREHEIHAGDLIRIPLADFYRDCLGKPLSVDEVEAMVKEANDVPDEFSRKIANVVYECKEGR